MDNRIILEAIAREMQSGVVVLNSKGEALYANPFFMNLFSVREAIEGKKVADLLSGTWLVKIIGDFLKRKASVSEDIETGEAGRFFSARLVPVKERSTTNLIIFLKDITEEKRVETIKKDFVANVSHELRTPLASIKGYAETLLDGGLEEKETLREFLRVIDRHATRMSRLIDDLLVLSRLESHQMTFQFAPVDMNELVSSTVSGFGKQAGDKGLKLSCRLPEGLPKALGDRDRLEQVIINLLDNAIKYTHSGGAVNIETSLDNGSVRVLVRDTGLGIPKNDIPRIFERFYRVDKARSRELGGTGLGLAIVKHIIQAHNGRVFVESEQHKGSTFSFSIKAHPKA